MLVEVLKENYAVVLSENAKDDRWLDQSGYENVGEEYYQILFDDIDDLVEELGYLIDYPAQFDDRPAEDAPYKVLEDLKAEGFIE